MCSYSDSTSDLDDELPVFDFLQPRPHRGQTSVEPDQVDLDDSDTEEAAAPTSAVENGGVGTPDVMMVSSDSEDDAAYVPLAQRLKQRQESRISASSTVTNGRDTEHCSQSSLDRLQFSCRNGITQLEAPLDYQQVRSVKASLSPEEEEEEAAPSNRQQLPRVRSDGASPAKRKRAKQTVEEIQASREEALRRRQAKESQKEALRLQQERQKAERRAVAEAAKALRPEECVKHMVVAVDPALLQLEGGGTLLAQLQTLGCSCAIEKQPLPRSVSWMRRTPSAQPDGGVCVPEAHVMMHMTVDVFCSLVHSYIQEERHGSSDSGPTLTSWVWQQQRSNPGKTLGLVVIDMEKYFRSQKSVNHKRLVTNEARGGKVQRKGHKGGANVFIPEVSRVEVEEAVVHLQLHTGVSVRFLSTWKDFSDHITMTTKAVAEAPFKREREKTGFSFYLESEWAGGQRVDRAGHGLLQVWKRQIQQLNRVSADMAAVIVAAYPSPQLLNKAYSLCKTDHERMNLLSDLLIRRGEGLTSTTRRVGPELSKRLYLTMTSRNPELALEST